MSKNKRAGLLAVALVAIAGLAFFGSQWWSTGDDDWLCAQVSNSPCAGEIALDVNALDLPEPTLWHHAFDVSPDGTQIAAAFRSEGASQEERSRIAVLALFDTSTGSLIREIDRAVDSDTTLVDPRFVRFSNTGRFLFAAIESETNAIYDLEDGDERTRLTVNCNTQAEFTADDSEVQCWLNHRVDVATGQAELVDEIQYQYSRGERIARSADAMEASLQGSEILLSRADVFELFNGAPVPESDIAVRHNYLAFAPSDDYLVYVRAGEPWGWLSGPRGSTPTSELSLYNGEALTLLNTFGSDRSIEAVAFTQVDTLIVLNTDFSVMTLEVAALTS